MTATTQARRDASAPATVLLDRLSKHFKSPEGGVVKAVDDITLELAGGSFVTLLGPSGCGKTTTLRMVAGLEDATEGEVFIGGDRVNHLTASQRNVAMAFQFYALYPSLSVAENLTYPLHAEKISEAERERRVAHVASVLELTDVLDRVPGRLAEGEKQRVSVGRAIIRDPNCFLFDEPLSRLDVQLRETMRGQIKEVLSDLKKATVIVTHDQLEALTMADRIAVMRDGHIEQVASPHDIFAKPSNIFVASFIGTPQMNLIPATVLEPAQGVPMFDLGAQQVAIPVRHAIKPGDKVTLGIRPRSLEPVAQAGPETIQAKVDLIEPMGAETLFHLADGEHELRVVVDRTRRSKSGEQLALKFRPEHTHIFDANEQLMQP